MYQWVASGFVLVIIFIVGLMWFSPIDPVRWTPPELAQSQLYCDAKRADVVLEPEVFVKDLPGTADGMAVSGDGRLFVAVKSGDIVEVNPDTGKWVIVANVAGARFLGISVSEDNNSLYAVDQATSSLFFFDIRDKNYPVKEKLLTNSLNGKKLLWLNDVISVDGGAYFTVTSLNRHYSKFRHELLEHAGNGLLLYFDHASRKTSIIQDNLYTANGVNIAPDGNSVLVAETSAYQLSNISRGGSNVTHPLENLPGLPGNISKADRKGTYWLAMVAPRVPLLDRLAPLPAVRSLVAWLPEALQPQPRLLPCVIEMQLDSSTTKARTVRFKGNEPFPTVATAVEYKGNLYLSPDASPKPGQGKHDGRLFRVKLPDPDL